MKVLIDELLLDKVLVGLLEYEQGDVESLKLTDTDIQYVGLFKELHTLLQELSQLCSTGYDPVNLQQTIKLGDAQRMFNLQCSVKSNIEQIANVEPGMVEGQHTLDCFYRGASWKFQSLVEKDMLRHGVVYMYSLFIKQMSWFEDKYLAQFSDLNTAVVKNFVKCMQNIPSHAYPSK